MAEVFRKVQSGPGAGMKTDRALAVHRKTQWDLRNTAHKGANRASFALDTFSEERTGSSYISVEHGKVDWYVVLNDTRGQGAANIIEFGRKGNKPESRNNTPSRPVAPLQWAFGKNWRGGY